MNINQVQNLAQYYYYIDLYCNDLLLKHKYKCRTQNFYKK